MIGWILSPQLAGVRTSAARLAGNCVMSTAADKALVDVLLPDRHACISRPAAVSQLNTS